MLVFKFCACQTQLFNFSLLAVCIEGSIIQSQILIGAMQYFRWEETGRFCWQLVEYQTEVKQSSGLTLIPPGQKVIYVYPRNTQIMLN